MFKRVLCAMLAAILLLSFCTALADGDSFTSTFTVNVDNTASDWISNSRSRALFTWCILLDYSFAGYDLDAIDLDSDPGYVGTKDGMLVLVVPTKKAEAAIFVFSPGESSIAYSLSDPGTYTASASERIMQNLGFSQYYANSSSDLMEVGQELVNALNS